MDFISNKTFEKLKYDLVREGLVQYEDLEKASELANVQKTNIGQILIDSNLLTEKQLLSFIESKLHIPYVDLNDYSLDKNCLKFIPYVDVKKYNIIPLFKIESVLTIAMSDPLDLFAIDSIVETTGLNIEPVISSETAIKNKILQYYSDYIDSDDQDICIKTEKNSDDEENESFDWQNDIHNQDLSDENIQKLIRKILKQSIILNVHELYFEHSSNGLSVNFKRDFDIENSGYIPEILVSSFIAKLKVLANLDPTVSEIPQLGKLIFKLDNLDLVASLSAFPTIMGERISLKIYKPPKSLNEIGIDFNKKKKIKEALTSRGITLVCGSVLSGKTHTIYSILSELSKIAPFDKKNIMTIESIAKYNLDNVNQCELNENIGFNLDKAMRFIEFQSPDIIYFEGINTKEGLDFFSSLVYKNKSIITEFLADNMLDLRNRLSRNEFSLFKSLLKCIILIHNKESIEIIDEDMLKKYLDINQYIN